MTNSTDLIERLTELDGKRTPGEWEYYSSEFITVEPECCGRPSGESCCGEPIACPVPFNIHDEANGEFVLALANEALPALIASKEREDALQADNERLREALKNACESLEYLDREMHEGPRPYSPGPYAKQAAKHRQALGGSHD